LNIFTKKKKNDQNIAVFLLIDAGLFLFFYLISKAKEKLENK